jgi:anti-sigma B factor antagonist
MGDPGGHRQSTRARLWTLQIAHEAREGVRILGVSGRIGIAASAQLAQALNEELQAGQTSILIDLAGVDYVSSAGLLVLQDTAAAARARGARLALCNLSEPVRVAFDLAGLTAEFAIELSCDAGVARLRSRDR